VSVTTDVTALQVCTHLYSAIALISSFYLYICTQAIIIIIIIIIVYIFSGSAAKRGLWPPRSRGFLITHNDAPQSVGLLRTSDQLVAETST
jgi:hypothetical protein